MEEGRGGGGLSVVVMVQWWHLSIPGLEAPQTPNLPGIAWLEWAAPPPSAALNAFLTGVSTEVWLDASRRVSGFAPLTVPSLGADIFKCAVCVAMQGNVSLQRSDMALVSRPRS